jgi:hypothetical protein
MSIIDSTSLGQEAIDDGLYTILCAFFRSKPMDQLTFAAIKYSTIRTRVASGKRLEFGVA